MSKFRFLTKTEAVGDEHGGEGQLAPLKILGAACELTDFANILYGMRGEADNHYRYLNKNRWTARSPYKPNVKKNSRVCIEWG